MASTSTNPKFEQYTPSPKPEKMGAWCERLGLSYDTYRRNYLRTADEDGRGHVIYPLNHPWAGVRADAFQERKFLPIWVEEPSPAEARRQLRERDKGRRPEEVTREQQRHMARVLTRHGWHVRTPPGREELEPVDEDGPVPPVDEPGSDDGLGGDVQPVEFTQA